MQLKDLEPRSGAQRLCGWADLKRVRQVNGPNQLGAVSDPPEKRAARALSEETRKMVAELGGVGQWGCLVGRVRVRQARASIDRAPLSPPGRPARARVSCAASEMAGARALVTACCCWWWLITAAGEYTPTYSSHSTPLNLRSEQLIRTSWPPERLISSTHDFSRFSPVLRTLHAFS